MEEDYNPLFEYGDITNPQFDRFNTFKQAWDDSKSKRANFGNDPVSDAQNTLQNQNDIEALWNELSGKNSQSREFLQEDYLLSREQEFQREREEVAMEYNSESAQVQRMLDAGINPNLMFGNSSSSKFQAVGSPSAPSVPSQGSAPAGSLNAVMGAINNTVDTFSRARNLASDTALKDIEIEWKPLREDAQLKVVNQNLDNLKKQYELSDEELTEMKAHFEQWQLTSPYEYYLVMAQFSNAVKEGELFDEKMKSEQKSREVMDSTVTANEASARQADAAAELYGSEKEKTDVEKDIRQDELNRLKKTVDNLPVNMDMKERITRLLSSPKQKDRTRGMALLKAYNKMNSDIYDATVEDARRNYWKQNWMKMGNAFMNNGASMMNMSNMAPYAFDYVQ